MRTEDYKINALVRATLVRRFVDTSKCIFTTIKGKVYIRGEIRQLFGGKGELVNPDTDTKNKDEKDIKEDDMTKSELDLLLHIEQDLMRIPNVVFVQFDLKHWRKEKGFWHRRQT